jgi:hypothetical protein
MILPYLAIALLMFTTLYSAIVGFRRPGSRESNWIFPEAAHRCSRTLAITFALVLLTGAAWWVGVSAKNSTRHPSRFLIPNGYTGWVRVEFEVQGTPPLAVQDGEYVLRILSDGILRTSSAEQYGWAKDHYYYYSSQGTRSLPDSGQASVIWGKINGKQSGALGKQKYEEFFVGTMQQFRTQVKGENDSR